MKILGYSERGIINSLLFTIGDDKELMSKFINLMNLPEPFQLGNPIDYTVLLEQSFSRFGDSDLVIIIHYEKPLDNKVLFIEGKVKTSNGSWNIQSQYDKYIKHKFKKDKTKDYWSNLFSQLYLKKLLIDNWNNIAYVENFEINSDLLGNRKIGSNKVVLEAFKLIKCDKKNAFYIGLIPTRETEFKNFKGIMDFEMSFLLWKKVHDFCKREEKLKNVMDIFEYNKGQIYKED
jgi:hypothetical protein